MKRSGSADLPLHGGHVPPWLAERMSRLGGAIIETLIQEAGTAEVLKRISDPFWFQALGSVMGMDWHSSGITTSVMGALKKALNPISHESGLYICGGRGKHSRKTPEELISLSERTGLNGSELVRNSKLTARIDNNAIQDGFQLYLHNFIITKNGEWVVIQQGMNTDSGLARRYHWHSAGIKSFVEEPHSGIAGKNQGIILDLTNKKAAGTRSSILNLNKERPEEVLAEFRRLVLPRRHDVKAEDVNIKRLGAALALAHDLQPPDFESMLLLEGVGPRTVQSLALVSEVIYGTPSRFEDPARFSFAHGGKDSHPFPVPTKVYDEAIAILESSVNRSKIGQNDKKEALRKLHELNLKVEKDFQPNPGAFNNVIEKERAESYKYGGRTVFGWAKKSADKAAQLNLFADPAK